MEILKIETNKKKYIDLLLLADEKDFFIKNYDKPIIENGVQLVDMVYLKKSLKQRNQNEKIR